MASTHKSLRSGTANKRPTTSIADGQIALNTNTTSPGLFFKDSTGATIIKVGPVHVGTTAPNASPAAGGSAGNSVGEIWLDTSLTPVGVKIWNGSAFVNATPIGSTTVQGLLELATSAETQTGTDTDRAVTPAGLQSKVSDSTSTTSSTTIASSTAVKSAYDLANAALPKSGGTVTGNLEIGTTGSLSFEGATADAFETTIAVTDPTADRTITLPDTTGTVVTTGDTGTVTSTMILDGTIVNGDINASAAIDHSKLANITAGSVLLGNASNVPTATALTGDVTISSSGVTAIGSGVIVNADVNASAAIAGTKISPDFGSQNTTTTGTSTAASFIPTSSTAPSNGVYLPSANNVAISTNGSGKIFVGSTGTVNFTGGGTAGSTQAVSFNGSAPVNSLVIDSSGRTGLGVASPQYNLHGTGYVGLGTQASSGSGAGIHFIPSSSATNWFVGSNYVTTGAFQIIPSTAGGGSTFTTPALTIDSSSRVGLGTSSPSVALHVSGATNATAQIRSSNTTSSVDTVLVSETTGVLRTNTNHSLQLGTNSTTAVTIDTSQRVGIGDTSPDSTLTIKAATSVTPLRVSGPSSEFARIDSSGRLLVGTSTARANFSNTTSTARLQVEGTDNNNSVVSITRNSANIGGSQLYLAKTRGTAIGDNTIVQAGDTLGNIVFQGSDGSEFVAGAWIYAEVDGTPGANDMPGRLVFGTTADGASSPTERARITSNGGLYLGITPSSGNDPINGNYAGISFNDYRTSAALGYAAFSRSDGTVLSINRKTNDGGLVDFFQDGTNEGTISVSGSTVTYGGGHLARWSQLPNDEDPSTLLKGTVMSNLDEMCEWGEEDNEQLNKTKVSDVEGDPSVAGVFVSTSFSDDGPLDFFVAMTGDMIIRIAEGVTVQRGDLLMSAGDGTAKPQDDDIIRSKTIAKVTSTHVTCTYEDGSYCVPCVLMAC
jgi:hypothetical protein